MTYPAKQKPATRVGQVAQDTAEKVANSVWLAAASRIGVPLLLAASIAAFTTLVGLERRMAQGEQVDREVLRRVEHLEQRREQDRVDYINREERIREMTSIIRADISAIRADQVAMLRALSRVEQIIDRPRISAQ